MKKLSVENITKACGGTYFGNETPASLFVTAITTDSRKADGNSLFIPLKGERADGHDYIFKTFEQGAVCSLSEKKINTDHPYILVKSTYQAIKDIAAYYRSLFNIPFIGI